MEALIEEIEKAILVCKENNAETSSSKAFVTNKEVLVRSTKKQIAQLKSLYKQGLDDAKIIKTCENTAREILECGNRYFKFNPNATVFLEETFSGDSNNVLSGLPTSDSMENFLRSVYETWHWHGW
jgi:hypothetical protein